MNFSIADFLTFFDVFSFMGIIILYCLLAFGLAISEEILTIIIAILISKNIIPVIPSLFGIFVGILLCDIIVYHWGVLLKRSSSKFPLMKVLYKKKEKLCLYDRYHNKYGKFAVFIIRFMIGVRFWLVLALGYNKYSLKTMTYINSIAAIPFMFIYLSLGYFGGHEYKKIFAFIILMKWGLIIILVILILFFIAKKFFVKTRKK